MMSLNHKGHILLGSDAPQEAAQWGQVLEGLGYAVEISAAGQTCIERTQERAPDLVLLKQNLPQGNAFAFLRTLHSALTSAVTGVVICVPGDLGLEGATLDELSGFDLLRTPVEMPRLLEKVENFFARRRHASGMATVPAALEMVETFKPRINADRGRFSLWGARGSTPTPGARFLRHGGNTSCLSVTHGNEKFVFDAGSGIRDLGLALIANGTRQIHLFITHTHWDHIQGFPFFAPAYEPGFDIGIYGAEKFGKDLESVFRGQLDREYFPVQMDDLNSSIRFHHLDANPVVIGDVKIWWEFAQHPGATVGYKIEIAGFKIAWVPDNEFLKGYTGPPEGMTAEHELVRPDTKMIDFLRGVDVLIHEAQYTNEEYPEKIGWGHSSLTNACLLVKFAGIRRWIVTHHDPMHDDTFLENKLNLTRQILDRIGHSCQVSHGYDGQVETF